MEYYNGQYLPASSPIIICAAEGASIVGGGNDESTLSRTRSVINTAISRAWMFVGGQVFFGGQVFVGGIALASIGNTTPQ